ncbi:Secretion system effector [Mycoavidus cysteinexigens]|uniref:Secretion system effector n=1 Tax=Mycoavidus cysteinexigens TaxID=1553431 RepID=A0A2Z6ETJ8_9BURK|nr:type III secretion system translocon subunit SctE [Mycoavidus cysteinexigens]BBE08753.1 Secretion system effector [Mycoavidus cysteinexigens]GAM52532.1 secretion system effector SseC [bacterium endosymbiont of Mortierella elongata FMR23-6]GLR01575.1 pathogenicity island 2 effector protein SseC [Mycoavidus cysteinexigens]
MSVTLNTPAADGAKAAYPLASDEEYANSAATRSVGRLDASKQVTEILAKQPEPLNRPTPGKSVVTLPQANQAMERIMERVGAPLDEGARLQLGKIETVSMDSMMIATTLLTGKVMGDTAEAKCKALEIMGKKQEAIRTQQVKEYCEQLDKATEQQEKAKKAGVFGVIFDWIVAAVEIGIGVLKLACGNPTGVIDIAAGVSGAVKAVANTLALIDPSHASVYGKIADWAGKIQMGLEVVGLAVDMLSAAVRGLAKVATNFVKQGGTFLEKAGALLKQAGLLIKKAAAGVVQKTSAAFQQMASTCMQMGQYMEKAGAYVKQAATEFMQNMSTVSEAGVGAFVKKMGPSVKDIGASIEQFAQKLKTDKAFLIDILKNTRNVVYVSGQLTSGVSQLERAKLQKQIDASITDQQWLQFCFDFYEKGKQATLKQMRDLLDAQSSAMEDGSKLLNQTNTLQAHVAASMV